MMPANESSPLAADYFQTARNVFGQITRGKIIPEFFFSVGGGSVRLRFASESLMPIIVPALAHLEIKPTASPDLTICLGDLAAANATLEFPGGPPKAALWRHDDRRFFVLAENEAGALSLCDVETGHAFYWVRDAKKLPWYESGFPLRHLLAAFFQRRDRHLIHAAAVGDKDGAVLIVGQGGAGKSTTALACATAGLFYLGDDYTLVGVEPAPRVWSLYASAKATAETLRQFPKLKSSVQHDGGLETKSLLLLNSAADFQLAKSRPVRAVLWPRISGRAETKLIPASPATLLLALAPSTLFQIPAHAESSFRALSRLVQSVPTFILEAGSDMNGLAETIKKFLSR